MGDLGQELRELRETVRLLTLENDRLSEHAAGLQLLGELARRVGQMTDPAEVIRTGLEQVGFLQEVPLGTWWESAADSGGYALQEVYATIDVRLTAGVVVRLPGAAASAGPSALRLLTAEDASWLALRQVLEQGGFRAEAALLCPLPAGGGPAGFLLFADHRPDHRLGEAATVLGRVTDLLGGRQLALRLQRELAEANQLLEERVEQRTRALRDREQRLRLLAEATFEGIAMTRNGIFVDLNEQLAAMLGCSREELIGTPVTEVVAPPSREEVWTAMAMNRTGVYEHAALRRDGTVFPVEIRARSLNLGGEVLRVTAVRDLTEQRKAEREHQRIEAALQQAAKLESLGVLAGGIAHDFNNLLTGILGNLGLARSDLDPASPTVTLLAEAELASRRAAELCRQLLAYSGRARFTIEVFDLRQLVRESLDLLRTSFDKKTLLHCQVPDTLPAMEGDATQIRQIIMNLGINASEALQGREGLVRVTLSSGVADRTLPAIPGRVGELGPGPFICLEVADTGCGMDAATVSRVFEPFFTTKFTGRGLGLSAVLGIVRAHRGVIDVESEPGQGTRFRVYFPASTASPEAIAGIAPPARLRGSGRVLLVDDEATVRRLGQRILERAGFQVVTATDGLDAVEKFRADPAGFRCVVLDLTMPKMNGAETLAALRQVRPTVPVVLASGYSEQELASRFEGVEVSGFLEKPYEAETLVKRVSDAAAV